jgi:tripartite-type tricarboxylate transporter receptor subunit TctC
MMFRLRNQGQRALKLGKPLLVVSFLALASLTHTQSHAQSYPNRTVKMVVPLTTGSGADIAGRLVA